MRHSTWLYNRSSELMSRQFPPHEINVSTLHPWVSSFARDFSEVLRPSPRGESKMSILWLRDSLLNTFNPYLYVDLKDRGSGRQEGRDPVPRRSGREGGRERKESGGSRRQARRSCRRTCRWGRRRVSTGTPPERGRVGEEREDGPQYPQPTGSRHPVKNEINKIEKYNRNL